MRRVENRVAQRADALLAHARVGTAQARHAHGLGRGAAHNPWTPRRQHRQRVPNERDAHDVVLHRVLIRQRPRVRQIDVAEAHRPLRAPIHSGIKPARHPQDVPKRPRRGLNLCDDFPRVLVLHDEVGLQKPAAHAVLLGDELNRLGLRPRDDLINPPLHRRGIGVGDEELVDAHLLPIVVRDFVARHTHWALVAVLVDPRLEEIGVAQGVWVARLRRQRRFWLRQLRLDDGIFHVPHRPRHVHHRRVLVRNAIRVCLRVPSLARHEKTVVRVHSQIARGHAHPPLPRNPLRLRAPALVPQVKAPRVGDGVQPALEVHAPRVRARLAQRLQPPALQPTVVRPQCGVRGQSRRTHPGRYPAKILEPYTRHNTKRIKDANPSRARAGSLRPSHQVRELVPLGVLPGVVGQLERRVDGAIPERTARAFQGLHQFVAGFHPRFLPG